MAAIVTSSGDGRRRAPSCSVGRVQDIFAERVRDRLDGNWRLRLFWLDRTDVGIRKIGLVYPEFPGCTSQGLTPIGSLPPIKTIEISKLLFKQSPKLSSAIWTNQRGQKWFTIATSVAYFAPLFIILSDTMNPHQICALWRCIYCSDRIYVYGTNQRRSDNHLCEILISPSLQMMFSRLHQGSALSYGWPRLRKRRLALFLPLACLRGFLQKGSLSWAQMRGGQENCLVANCRYR